MPKRYTYKGSYKNPRRLPFRPREYVPDADIHDVLRGIVADPEMLHETVIVIEEEYVQGRWKRSAYGTLAQLFPEVLEVHEVLTDPALTTSLKEDLEKALKRGLSDSISRTRKLLSSLEKLGDIETRRRRRLGKH